MRYGEIVPARFIDRPNRFIANVMIEDRVVECHVKNTGRCREILVPGAEVWLERAHDPRRRTGYDLIAVHKGRRIINIDSQAPNKVIQEWLRAALPFGEGWDIRPETTHGDSRFDFMLQSKNPDKKLFIEVKGCTLERDGVTLFPDAPTERGAKHIRGLMKCLDEGYGAALVILVQMGDVRYFTPNSETDPAFAKAMTEAYKKGVTMLCLDSIVTPDSIIAGKPVEIRL